MSRGRNTRVALSCLLLASLVGGCSKSPPVRFYMLSATSTQATPSVDPVGGVAVARVGIAKYLDRPQIVTRAGSHSLVVAEFDRWGEALEFQVPRVLEENLARRLGTECLPAGAFAFDVVDYRLRVSIIRMDGTIGQEAVLEARWRVDDSGSKALIPLTRSRYVVPSDGDGYEAFAAATSKAVGQLSEEIATAIRATK